MFSWGQTRSVRLTEVSSLPHHQTRDFKYVPVEKRSIAVRGKWSVILKRCQEEILKGSCGTRRTICSSRDCSPNGIRSSTVRNTHGAVFHFAPGRLIMKSISHVHFMSVWVYSWILSDIEARFNIMEWRASYHIRDFCRSTWTLEEIGRNTYVNRNVLPAKPDAVKTRPENLLVSLVANKQGRFVIMTDIAFRFSLL